jgi:hypothetical protein
MSNQGPHAPRDRRVLALRAAVFALVESMEAVVRVARWPRDEAAPEPLVDCAGKVVERLAAADRFLASRYEGRNIDAESVAAMCDAARKLDVAYRAYRTRANGSSGDVHAAAAALEQELATVTEAIGAPR